MSGSTLDEIRKKYGVGASSNTSSKEEASSTKPASTTAKGSSALDEIRRKYGVGPSSRTDSSANGRVYDYNHGVDVFNYTMDGWNKWYEASRGGLESVGFVDAGDAYTSIKDESSSMLNRLAQSRKWAQENKDKLGDNYDAIMAQLQEATTATYWMNKNYENTADFYSQWDSQEAYDQAFAPAEQEVVMGKDVGQMQSDLDAMRQAYDDLDEILVYREAGYGTVPEAEREQKKAWHDERYQEILDAYGVGGSVSKWDLMDRISKLEDEIGETGDTQEGIRAQNAEANRLAGYYMKYSGMDYAQLKQAMETVTDPEEKAFLRSFAGTKMTAADYESEISATKEQADAMLNYIDVLKARYAELDTAIANYSASSDPEDAARLATAQRELDTLLRQLNDAEEDYDSLMTRNWQLDHDARFRTLRESEDFDDFSGYVVSKTDDQGNVVNTTEDPLYRYINSRGGELFPFIREDHKKEDYDWIEKNVAKYSKYTLMTDAEIEEMNYLYRTQGKQAASDYITWLSPTLDARAMGDLQEGMAEMTANAPGWANALSVPMMMSGGLGYLNIATQNAAKKITGSYQPINYNNANMAPTKAAQTIRGTTAAMITDAAGTIQLDEEKHPILAPILNGRGLADVYQLGMSAIDSKVAALTGNPVLATTLLASSAATQGVLDALERGATDEQALTLGLWNGAFEAIFEFWEVKELLKGNPSWVKAAVNQAITEGVGEGLTDVANSIADVIIMADNSQIMADAQKYMDANPGMTENEAIWKAVGDAAIDAGWSMVGGAASGAMSVGGMAAGNAVMNRVQQYAALPKTVKNSIKRLQGFGMDKGAATDISIALYQGAEGYGDQAAAYMAAFDPNQDPYTYASDFRQAYEIGRNNGNREYLGKLSLNEDQRKIAYELGAAASRKAAQEATAPENSESDEERTYSVSDEGTTIDSTGKAVKVMGFTSVGDKAVLELEDGKTIDAKEVSFGTEDEAVLYETAAKVSGSADTANRIMNSYSSVAGKISASDFAAGLRQAYDLGVSGQVAERQLGTYELAGKLPAAVRSAAFNRGKTVGDYKATARQAALEARGRQVKGQRQGQLHFDRKGRTFDSKRESSLKAMEALSKALGVNIYVYESYVENGKRVYQDRTWAVESAPNGFYDKDGIHIDLNAGNFGQGTMMFTVAHELTHFIKEWSPVKFRKLADILVNRYAEQGTSVRELIDRQIAKARENGREIDRDTAFEEVVADSMETMLTQGDIGQMMAELKQKDKTLAEKVREWFRNLADSLKAVADEYRGAKPESPEGRLVAQMDDFVQVLQQAYAEALVEAGENYRANNKKADSEKQPAKSGVEVAQDQKKFSMRDPVEYTKNLVALHNLTEDKLAKTLELGGFPMPSIAITKADIPHTNFGDITLVFGRETIDPKANRKNTVYSADAWTPVFPRTEYEENQAIGSAIYKRLVGLEKKIDDHFRDDLRRVYMDIEGTLNRYDGEEGLIQYAMDNYGLKAAYLEEQGDHIEKAVTQVEAEKDYNPDHADRYRKIADIMGVKTGEEMGAYNLAEAKDEHGDELEAIIPGITKSAFRMARIFGAVRAYLNDQGTGPVYKTVTDASATRKAVDDALDMAAYEAWVRKLFAGIVKDSGIYNNKPIFTPSGNRRSFKQTHLPVTLENIVKAMASQNDGSTKNVSGFNGIKTLRAGTAERFKSIEAMHQREGRLQNLTQEELEAVNDALQSRLYDIIKAIDDENGGKGSDNSMIRYDTIGEIITEISESGKFNVADIQQTFRGYGKEVSDDTALALKQLLFDVAQMPVNIFEAKPERVVGLNEIKAAILPSGTSQKVVEKLEQNGVPVRFYEAGNDAERVAMVNSMEEAKFSDRDAGAEKVAAALERQNAKLKRDVKDLRELLSLQGKLTHGSEFTKSSIEEAMRSLIKAAGSRLNADDRLKMAGMLKDLYRYIAGDKELTWDGVEERAGAIADLLMNNVNIKAQRDSYADDILGYLRGTKIKLSDSQRAEVEKLYGYENYRKMLFGAKVYIGRNGIDLDSLWHEASRPDMFGGTFKDDVNEGDQPAALLDIIENMREGDDSAAMEYAYNWESIRQGLIQSIYDRYWQLETLETVADKKKAQMDKLREDHRKLMDEIREDQKYTLEKLRTIRENVLYTVRTDYEKGSYAPVKLIAESWKTDRKRALGEFRQIEDTFIQMAKDFERFGQQQVNQRAKDQKGFDKAREQFEKALKKEAERHDKDNALWTREFERLLKEYDKSGRKIERLEERYKTREENLATGKQRAAVEKAAKSLMDMLSKPSKEAHVPMALQAPLEKFLNSIDFSSKRSLKGGELTIRDVAYTRALQEVKTAIAKQRTALEGDADGTFSLDVPKDLLDRIEEHIGLINKATEGLDLTTNRVYEMTSDELKDLAFILKTINRAIRDIDKLHMAGAKARVSELGQSTVSEMDSREAVKTEDGGWFMWRNYTPTFAFERMGQAATQILNGLKMGQAKLARTAAAVIKFSNETYTNKEVKAWENEVHDVELDSGETVKMTTAQIMSFYCLSRREQAKGHLTGGGIRMGNIGEGRKTVRQTKHFRLTQNDIAKINGLLTDRQIAVANKMQRYMADVGGRLGNEISMARWDYMEMTDRDYFPIRSDSDIHDARNPDQDKTNLWALLNKSFTKAVVKDANDAMIVSSIFDVFADHMSDMAEYNAFALPLVDAMKWYNYRESTKYESGHVKTVGVKKALTDKLGTAAGEYFVDLMTDINSSQKAGRYENFFGKLLSRSKAASVGWNLRVAIQQPTAILRASVYLDPMSLVKGTVKKGMKASIEEMKKYSGIALWKSLGYYDLNISRGIRDQIKGDTTVLDQINDAGMWLPGKVDEATWSRIWESCKAQVSKEQKLSGERLLEETAKLFEDVVYHTQVADSVLTRSGLMRSKSQTLKELTSFMAEPTLSVNLLLNAFQDYREGVSKSDKVKRTMKILFCGYVLSAVANAIATAFMDAFRDDDEYEGYWDKFFQALLGEKFYDGNLFAELNPLEKIVFVRDILSMIQGYEGAKNPFVELAESGIKLVQNIVKFFQGKGSLTVYGLIYQSLQVLGGFTGAAPANLLREASTIWNWTFGKWNNMPLHRYKTDPKSQIRDAYKSGALEKSEAREALMAAGISVTDAYWIIKDWDAGESTGRYDDVYKAALAGDDIGAAVAELVEHGEKTEKEVLSELRKQIKKWYTDPESDTKITKDQAQKMVDSYLGLEPEAGKALVEEWTFELEHGYSYDDIKYTYLDDQITAQEAKDVLVGRLGKTEAEADLRIQYWEYLRYHRDSKLTEYQVADYYEYAEPAEITADVYERYIEGVKGIEGQGTKARKMAVIDQLPLTDEQKDALYFANDWAKSTLREAPWHLTQ